MRKVDYNLEELASLAGLPRKKCRDNLVRICDEYGLKLKDFKVDDENENSDFLFTPEIAAPLALLIKYWDQHPFARKNVDKTKVTASTIANYNRVMLDGIDSELTQYFNDAIYSIDGHLVAREIADWTEPFVRELTHFMINISTLSYENIGEAMCFFTRSISEMNYQLHRGGFIQGKARRCNEEYAIKHYHMPEDSDIDKKLQNQNLGLDRILVYLIEWQLDGVRRMRAHKFPDIKEIIEDENRWLKYSGRQIVLEDEQGNAIELDAISDLPKEQQRDIYINLVLGKTVNYGRAKINRNCINVKIEQKKEWKPIEEQIEEEIFDGASVKDEYQRYLEQEILRKKRELEIMELQLQEFKETGDVPFRYRLEDDNGLKDRQADYVQYCKELDGKYKSLHKIVDVFVGQALNEFLKE